MKDLRQLEEEKEKAERSDLVGRSGNAVCWDSRMFVSVEFLWVMPRTEDLQGLERDKATGTR
jgi:hypothetical protein